MCGFILKSASPTCGMERVKVYKPLNAPSVKNGVGLFAKQLQENVHTKVIIQQLEKKIDKLEKELDKVRGK